MRSMSSLSPRRLLDGRENEGSETVMTGVGGDRGLRARKPAPRRVADPFLTEGGWWT